MAGGYKTDLKGMDAIIQRIRNLATRIDGLQKQFANLGITIDRITNSLRIGGGRNLIIEGGGTLAVQDESVSPYAVMGALSIEIPDGSGRKQMAFVLQRDDGTIALQLQDTGTTPGHTHQQALQWRDRAQNIVMADDTTSGIGIATPYIAMPFASISLPTDTTTSTSFVSMAWSCLVQQHPKITAFVLAQTPSGTTGEVRLTVHGKQIGSPVTVPSNSFTTFQIPIASWPAGEYAWQQSVTVALEARVTSGTGAIGVRGISCWGTQS